ncbi:hypothetical protein LIER_23594 [Lithospermum erythrorhizon]|uniref:Uncharacterized protein n=1 Tax=Lithospermum erythrorhizon TaxID=34254 RepID=A0AAV3QY54_LITER
MDVDDFDMRDIDEYAMRTGCSIKGKTLYAYTVEGRGFGWLKLLLCEADMNEFRKLEMKENFMDVYIECNPNLELLKLYSSGCRLRTVVPRVEYCSFRIAEPVNKTLVVRRGTPIIVLLLANFDYNKNSGEYNETKGQSSKENNDVLDLEFLGDLTQDIEYENDVACFRESDLFDDELDREIRAENIVVQQKEAKEIGEMARQFQIEPDSEKVDDETCSKPRRKGSYARHGVEFKIRKSTGYRESSSDDATDNVLSESDVSDDITSIVSSSDEEEVDRQ